MKELSLIDSKLVEQFTNAIGKFRGQNVFDGIGGTLKMLPLMGSLMKFAKVNLKEHAQELSDPFLRKALHNSNMIEVPTLVPIIFLSKLSIGDAGWPLEFSGAFRQY